MNTTDVGYTLEAGAGKYFDPVAGRCEDCPVGTAAASGGFVARRQYGAGGQEEILTCSVCAPGTHQPSPGQSRCLPCPQGSYTRWAGSTKCLSCPANTSRPTGTLGADISDCDCILPGFRGTGYGGCASCPAGARQTVGTDGFQTCEVCPVFTYANTSGSTSCLKCPQDFFSELSPSYARELSDRLGPGWLWKGESLAECDDIITALYNFSSSSRGGGDTIDDGNRSKTLKSTGLAVGISAGLSLFFLYFVLRWRTQTLKASEQSATATIDDGAADEKSSDFMPTILPQLGRRARNDDLRRAILRDVYLLHPIKGGTGQSTNLSYRLLTTSTMEYRVERGVDSDVFLATVLRQVRGMICAQRTPSYQRQRVTMVAS